LFATERDTSRYSAVNVGDVPWFDVAISPAGAGEHTQGLGNLLLQVEAHAGPAGVTAYRIDVGGPPGSCRKPNGICEFSCPAPTEKTSDLERAGLPPQFMPSFDFSNQLELVERRVEIAAGRAQPAGRGYR
jgi:hypothetical protein